MVEMITERLVLRRFLPDDWKDLYEYLSIEEVVRYEPYGVFTKEECIKESIERYEAEDDSSFWAVCLKENDKMIGHIYFQQTDPKKFMTWALGYVFNPKYYHKGYATEACKRILQYAFEDCDAHRIVAGVNVKNIASWKLLERLNMRREAHFLQNVFFNRDSYDKPVWNDSYRYGILAEEV
ncbi:GNAT family N-acetyltransferase [Clostridium sp. D2Q-11]|uniref:GNAT family N-acetyltransferase n=1 Tax=Anaeromonas frigoriresistens TaxID=2683708 RepID=A0A942Z7P1_9FIRM|nr:GNAT family N-acetyltransferase [Anaeromonas frigoriresistens]MBS4538912.1 GNAT family N-acetyltransferase [Anaeromonas frigoriresistens]